MAIEISIPPLGWSSDDAIFAGWIKADGDAIAPGDAIYNVETEKATQEIESLDGGQLHILPGGPKVGDRLPVGTVIGYLLMPGEASPVSGPPRSGQPVAGQPTSGQSIAQLGANDNGAAAHAGSEIDGRSDGSRSHMNEQRRERRPAISPRAKRAAAELGVDWTQLAGSGSTGRIRERDVLAAIEARTRASATAESAAQSAGPPSDTDCERIPVTGMRRTIAERMMIGGKSTAPVTLTSTTDATDLVNLRGQFQAAAAARGDNAPIPSYTDFLSKLTALALVEHPVLNARWDGDHILIFKQIHLGIAVDTPAGLGVPVIRDAARLSLASLVTRTRDLVDRARRRKLSLEEMQGGTFTISNLGSFGVDAFTPIINHPEAAVLGVGRIRREPAACDNQIALRDMLTLSLTFDHRIVDGAPAARFLQTLCEFVRNPGPRLIG